MPPPPTPDPPPDDGMPPAEAVVMAWTYPGRRPDWHAMCKAELRASMPLLARALDRLAAEQGRG